MQNQEHIVDAIFKDDSPVATVEKIISILRRHGIEPVERWGDTCVPYCFYLSVKIHGTNFSVNGKGLTKEFARASGYGELMERLQLGLAKAPAMQKDGTYSFDTDRFPPVPVSELIDNHGEVFEAIARRSNTPITAEAMVKQFADASGQVPCVSCYDLTTGRTVPFPNDLRLKIYGSNGSAAGNTYEEAIVQALSEIVERHNQYCTLQQQLTLPDVPEERLHQCPIAYRIISHLREQNFQVIIKDCSLGEKFPVICAVVIDRTTGKYHAHFGAYPIFEIALERALTESFQGHSIRTIAEFDDFLYSENEVSSLSAVSNEFTRGSWKKSVEFFYGMPRFPYRNHLGFAGGNNQTLLKECVEYFKEMGLHILVYNAATLGFPTCQVLVPGYSELFTDRLCLAKNPYRYFYAANRALRCPSEANLADKMGLLMHLDQMKQHASGISKSKGFVNNANLSVTLTPEEDNFLMNASLGFILYDLGRKNEALRHIDAMLHTCQERDVGYLTALKRYLRLSLQGRNSRQIREILQIFHDPSLTEELCDLMETGQNPLERFTLHCRMDCAGTCPLRSKCCHQTLQQLCQMISQKQKELDYSAFLEKMSHLLS